MSNRLHVGKTDDLFYDCVITTDSGVREKLESEWLISKPLKIRIGDEKLWNMVSEKIEDSASKIIKYPDDIWAFYYKDRRIEHPSKSRLKLWLKRNGVI